MHKSTNLSIKRIFIYAFHHILFCRSLSRVNEVGRGVIALGIGGSGARIAFGKILTILLVYETTLEASEILFVLSFED